MGPSQSWGLGCCCWTAARTRRPFGDLCSGALTAGAGRSPPGGADTPPPGPAPTETAAGGEQTGRVQPFVIEIAQSLSCTTS